MKGERGRVQLRRLPIKNAYNIRELGGYATTGGQVTNHQQFLRGDDLTHLDEADLTYLRNYGVKSIIDLRSDYELHQGKNPLISREDVHWLHAPLLTIDREMVSNVEGFLKGFSEDKEGILTRMYVDILQNSQQELQEIFTFIAAQEGCVLFHCTAGKDRTGVLAMLLLGLAGVSRPDIIANYMVSEVYHGMNPRQRVMDLPIDFPNEVLQSKPQFIAGAYDSLIENYGSIKEYLLSIGITKESLEAIQQKLIA